MKRILIAILSVLAIAAPASAQFRWGLKAGVEINSLHFSDKALKDVMSSDNRAGFVGGLTTEFTVPLIGLGFDASVLYVNRTTKLESASSADRVPELGKDFIEVPIHLKYKLSLPAIEKIVAPYVFTGPSFAFLCSKQGVTEAWEQKKWDVSWNIGLGVQLVNHLQLGASYGIGLNKALDYVGHSNPAGTNQLNCWTVTLGYLF